MSRGIGYKIVIMIIFLCFVGFSDISSAQPVCKSSGEIRLCLARNFSAGASGDLTTNESFKDSPGSFFSGITGDSQNTFHTMNSTFGLLSTCQSPNIHFSGLDMINDQFFSWNFFPPPSFPAIPLQGFAIRVFNKDCGTIRAFYLSDTSARVGIGHNATHLYTIKVTGGFTRDVEIYDLARLLAQPPIILGGLIQPLKTCPVQRLANDIHAYPDGTFWVTNSTEMDLYSPNCSILSSFSRSDLFPPGHAFQGVVSNDAKTKLWVANGTIFEFDVLPAAPSLPDLLITDVKPVQVVFDADINNDGRADLVQGKQAVVSATVKIQNSTSLNDTISIDIQMSFGSIQVIETKALGDLIKDPEVRFFFTPQALGDNDIIIEADKTDKLPESNETNNVNFSNITVKDTNEFIISYYKIDSPIFGSAGDVNFTETFNNGNLFINGTYPLADEEFKPQNFGAIPLLGISALDRLILSISAWIGSDFKADAVVGVATTNYLTSVDPLARGGISFPSMRLPTKVALVEQDFWTGPAHEIGHLLGLDDRNGSVAGSGFWVERKLPRENLVTFMLNVKNTLNVDNRWIAKDEYEALFRNLSVADPPLEEALMVSAAIFKNGTVLLGPWVRAINVSTEPLPPGNLSIITKDLSGNIIDGLSFSSGFTILVDPIGVVDVDYTLFGVPVPYGSNVAEVEIKMGNSSLVSVMPTSKLLADAIERIPDQGFVKSPSQRRKALLNKVSALEETIKKGQLMATRNKLNNDIKDKISKWISDDFPKRPDELSKADILELIDNLIERLNV